MIHQIIGPAWFVGAAMWGISLGESFGFLHVVALGHMALGAMVALGAFNR